jgi:transcriptional regulator of met regulon
MKKIPEYNENEQSDCSNHNSDSDSEIYIHQALKEFTLNTDPQDLLNQVKQQLPPVHEDSSNVMKNLLGDIKGMLSGGQNMDTKNILDMSKDLSNKYQNMIDTGDLNITDLFSGVMGLLNNPDAIGEEFGDFDGSNLPNPNDLMSQMADDPSLKQAMEMMNGLGINTNPSNSSNSSNLSNFSDQTNISNPIGGLDMNMLGAMMSGMMGTMNSNSQSNNEPKTVRELEKEIERLMADITNEDPTNEDPTDPGIE